MCLLLLSSSYFYACCLSFSCRTTLLALSHPFNLPYLLHTTPTLPTPPQASNALRPPSSSSSSTRPRTSALFQFLHPSPSSSSPSPHHHHSHSCGCGSRSSSSLQPISHTSLHQQRRAPPPFLSLQGGPLLDYDIIHVAGDVVAGFVGGAVGVMGTIMALEVKMRQGREGGRERREGREGWEGG